MHVMHDLLLVGGPGEVSCIESCPFEKAYLGHSKMSIIQMCPHFRGVLEEGLVDIA